MELVGVVASVLPRSPPNRVCSGACVACELHLLKGPDTGPDLAPNCLAMRVRRKWQGRPKRPPCPFEACTHALWSSSRADGGSTREAEGVAARECHRGMRSGGHARRRACGREAERGEKREGGGHQRDEQWDW